MTSPDVEAILQSQAGQKLYELMRQGLTAAATIPEVTTDAEAAAHQLLGCDSYQALIIMYQSADAVRPDEPNVAQIITDLADGHLRTLTQAVIFMRGPIGRHTCEKGADG